MITLKRDDSQTTEEDKGFKTDVGLEGDLFLKGTKKKITTASYLK